MQADQFGRRDHGHGCEANNSLLEHRLIESERAGKAAWIRSFSSLFVSVCDCVWLTLYVTQYVMLRCVLQCESSPSFIGWAAHPAALHALKGTAGTEDDAG